MIVKSALGRVVGAEIGEQARPDHTGLVFIRRSHTVWDRKPLSCRMTASEF